MKAQVQKYFELLKNTIDKIDLDEIETFIRLLHNARDNGKKIFIMGNGGSAATSSHYCCDFNKGMSYQKPSKPYRFISLNDNIPTLMAYANDVGYDSIFVEQLKNMLEPEDLVIGISGSGNSENVLKAIEYANQQGGITVGLTGFNGGRLKQMAQHSVNANINNMQISEDIHMLLAHMTYFISMKSE